MPEVTRLSNIVSGITHLDGGNLKDLYRLGVEGSLGIPLNSEIKILRLYILCQAQVDTNLNLGSEILNTETLERLDSLKDRVQHKFFELYLGDLDSNTLILKIPIFSTRIPYDIDIFPAIQNAVGGVLGPLSLLRGKITDAGYGLLEEGDVVSLAGQAVETFEVSDPGDGSGSSTVIWGGIQGVLSDQIDLQSALSSQGQSIFEVSGRVTTIEIDIANGSIGDGGTFDSSGLQADIDQNAADINSLVITTNTHEGDISQLQTDLAAIDTSGAAPYDDTAVLAAIDTKLSKTPEPWVFPVLVNGWGPPPSPWQTARFRRLENGLVVLQGAVHRASSNNNKIFDLPEGYRPSGDLYYPVRRSNAGMRIIIRADGGVIPENTASTATSTHLDGIVFFAGS
ncbi:MAG: hypothetical protein F6K19_42590 [Cyanothece sp. SIO1E1]|nr:hypothetical protein [Cyanothece sp. SIO1E1]